MAEPATNQPAAPAACDPINFHGISFQDGNSVGMLRLFSDHVELLVDEPLTFALDGTIPHTFRVTGQGKDVKLYVDGQLAINGTGKFTRSTSSKEIEFGSLSPKSSSTTSLWETFRYSVEGAHAPSDVPDYVMGEVMELPGGAVGKMRDYKDMLYVSLDPADLGESSVLYRYDEGHAEEPRNILAVTQTNVTSVLVDPNRNGNAFGTTGKFVGTDRGLQYVLGGKPNPYDMITPMTSFPDEGGWDLENNCETNCASILGGTLTIDTRSEIGTKYWKYVQRKVASTWADKASNELGWTIEANVRIGDDGAVNFSEDGESSPATSPYAARDVVLVISTASTMGDEGKMAQARRVAETILSQLRGQDKFNVISFSGAVSEFDSDLVEASRDNIKDALDFVQALTSQGNADMLAAMTQALSYSFSASKRIVVLVSDGKADSNPYTLLSSVRTANASGPQASIDAMGMGTGLLAQFPVYKYMLDQMAAQNDGISMFVQPTDNVDDKALLFWRGAGGIVFDFEPGGPTPSIQLDAQSAVMGRGADLDPQKNGLAPPDDDIYAPGMLVNDGKYQEIVQLFRNGIRLKYAKLFAPVDLSSRFVTLRIIGREQAIAVYARGNGEKLFKKLIFEPNGLFIKSFLAGDQEKPALGVDKFGFMHAAWQDSRDGYWAIYYSKMIASKVLAKGTIFSRGSATTSGASGTSGTSNASISLDLVRARVGLGLPPAAKYTMEDLPNSAVMSATGKFLSLGIKPGDLMAISGKRLDASLNVIGELPTVTYRVKQVVDEWVILLDTAEDLSTKFFFAEYLVYQRGSEWLPPIRVSPQLRDSNNPALLMHSSGDVIVAYDNDEHGNKEIYVTRMAFSPLSFLPKENIRVTSSLGLSVRPSLAEMSDASVVVAWEDSRNDANKRQVFYSQLKSDELGSELTLDLPATALTDPALTAANVKVAALGTGFIAIYEYDQSGQDIYASFVSGKTITTTQLSSGGGRNPSMAPYLSGVMAAWEMPVSNIEVQSANITLVNDLLVVGSPLTLTNSRGDSTNPSVACFSDGRAIIAFQSDRTRTDYPNLYLARLWPMTTGSLGWMSSGTDGLDLRIEGYVSSSRRPAAAIDSYGNVALLFEAVKDGQRSRIGRATYDGATTTMDNSLVGYFPLDEDSGVVTVHNAIHLFRSDLKVQPSVDGTAAQTTNVYHVPAPDTGVSLFSPSSQGAFDLNENGRAFKVDKSLLGQTGGLEFWMQPHWPSIDLTQRVILGNADIDTLTPDTMSFGVKSIPGGNVLRFRTVDSDGNIHQTEVFNAITTNFSWNQDDMVHVRLTWDANAIGISSMSCVSFIDNLNGFACGQCGRIFRTTDGGVTWSLVASGVTYDLYSIDFPTSSLGFISGEMGTILATTDGGTTWSVVDAGTDEDLLSVCFRTNLVGYAVGSSGLIMRSADGGATWTKISNPATLDLRSVAVLRDGSSYAVVAVGANGQICRSTDDGLTFSLVTNVTMEANPPSLEYNFLSRTHQAGPYTSYIAGNKGMMLFSTDAGASWDRLLVDFNLGYQPNLNCVAHGPNPDYVYVVGQNGFLARSLDGGVNWQTCGTAIKNGPLNSIEANFGGAGTNAHIVAVGIGGSVLLSDNGGQLQTYSMTRSGNLSIQLDGKEPAQDRTGDVPFTWTPGNHDLFFGDHQFNGTETANAAFDELYVYKDDIPARGSILRQKEPNVFQADDPRLVHRPEMEKRIEWGQISDQVKSSSYWTDVRMFLCGAKEPLQCFSWNAQLGEADDVIRDLSIDKQNRIWMATENGISSLDINEANNDIENWLRGFPQDKSSTTRFINLTNLYNNLPTDSISSIATDDNNNIWAGTDKGLIAFASVVPSTYNSPADVVDLVNNAIKSANDPRSYFGPQPQMKIFTVADGLPSDNVLVVRVYGDNVFVGTDKGLAILTLTQQGAQVIASSDSGAAGGTGGGITQTSTLKQGTFIQGVSTTSTASTASTTSMTSTTTSTTSTVAQAQVQLPIVEVKAFTTKDGLPSNRVQVITKDEKAGEIWIGTDKGIGRFSSLGQMAYGMANGIVDNNIYSITMDKAGDKYVGTGKGLSKITGPTIINFQPSYVGSGAIQGGAVDSTGSKWFATSLGLLEMSESCDRTSFTRYSIEDGLIGDPAVVDFQRFRILGDPIPGNDCEKALVSVRVNGQPLASGYSVLPYVPMLVFDEPLRASDKVEVSVDESWRKVYEFSGDLRNPSNSAMVQTSSSRFLLYRKLYSAGTVTLGGNLAKGAGNSSAAMYLLFAASASGLPAISSITSPTGAVHVIGVTKGAHAYSDDADEALQAVPSNVLEQEMVQLPKADQGDDSAEYVILVLSESAMVYVGYDSRSPILPYWLRSFDPVPAVFRITDMTTMEDASGDEKLFISVSGTNGCVYDVLHDPTICDVSDSIAIDQTGPVGCARITKAISGDKVLLALSATDEISGVADMQVSNNPSFDTLPGTINWTAFKPTYEYQFPPGQNVGEINDEVVPNNPASNANLFFDLDGDLLVGTSNPGSVYAIDQGTKASTLLFNTGEQEVLSLIKFGDLLVVGTGTNGKVFTWDGHVLSELTLGGNEKISSMAVFNNRLFLGTSPSGKIYEVDSNLAISLFEDTFETEVTGFAVFGGRLFWTTANDSVDEGDVLPTTTRNSHRHSITVQAGALRLAEVNGTTSVSDGHSHVVTNGTVMTANGHTHSLNGLRSGKVFRHDLAVGQTIVVHADKDYRINAITATSNVMFVGTHPNGKILRYVATNNVFIKSFDTSFDTISRLRALGSVVYALAGGDVFFFDGTRWQFLAGTTNDLNDVFLDGTMVMLLGQNSISETSSTPTTTGTTLCAFVRFRDVVGNVTDIRNADGSIPDCYHPCHTIGGTTGAETTGGTTGGTTSPGAILPPLVHRISEVDGDANVLSTLYGAEAFLSGMKIEQEVGVYESEVFNGTTSLVQWTSISWDASVPAGSSLTVAVRSARTSAEIQGASWSGELSNPASNDITSLQGQFLQFRATLRVLQPGVPSPELRKVDIELRTSQATHYYTTNFKLPDELRSGILTYNGCINPPVTDVVFGMSSNDVTDFSDYLVITPNKVFDVPDEQRKKNLRIGIKLISSPTSVPVVDEFALLFSLANDAIIRLNLPGMPSYEPRAVLPGTTRTVVIERVSGHVHTITFDSRITDKFQINGKTSINSGHSHDVVSGTLQVSAGHQHEFAI